MSHRAVGDWRRSESPSLIREGFARAAIHKRTEPAELIAARQQVTEAFNPEISEENRVAAEQAGLDRKESNMLDEIGANVFLRKRQE